jgi:hypothetical protein
MALTTVDGSLITGTLTSASEFASATRLTFHQASAPTGWTQDTTLNDYALRLVSGSGGTTGGTTAYSTVFANQTPTFTGSIGSLAGGATTLSTAQMPSHNHSSPYNYGGGLAGTGDLGSGPSEGTSFSGYVSNSTGGGNSHSHSITGTPSGTVGAVTLNVRYANIIICSKN